MGRDPPLTVPEVRGAAPVNTELDFEIYELVHAIRLDEDMIAERKSSSASQYASFTAKIMLSPAPTLR